MDLTASLPWIGLAEMRFLIKASFVVDEQEKLSKYKTPFIAKNLNSSSLQTRVQRHPFERIATPFQVYSWTAPQAEHAMDCVRAEDAYTSRLGYEEHIPGQVCSYTLGVVPAMVSLLVFPFIQLFLILYQ